MPMEWQPPAYPAAWEALTRRIRRDLRHIKWLLGAIIATNLLILGVLVVGRPW